MIKFDHSMSSIPEALGFTLEMDNLCREIVYFSTVSNYFITDSFYDDTDEVPNNLSTITGILEKAINLCSSEDEKIYLMFVFKNCFEMISKVLTIYKMLNNETSYEERKKLEIIMEMSELKALSDKSVKRDDLITPKQLINKIGIIKENPYNFDEYYKIVSSQVDA